MFEALQNISTLFFSNLIENKIHYNTEQKTHEKATFLFENIRKQT